MKHAKQEAIKRGGTVSRPAFLRAIAVSSVLTLMLVAYLLASGLESVPYFCQFGDNHTLIVFIAVVSVLILFAVICFIAYQLTNRSTPRLLFVDANSDSQRYSLCCFNPRSILLTALTLFMCWLPIMIVFYPGVLTFDGLNQLYQYAIPAPTWYTTTDTMLDAEYIDHHPIVDTLLYGFYVYFIGGLFGSQNVGMFLFGLTQAGLTSFSVAFSICLLEELCISHRARFAVLILSCLFFIYPINSVTMLKDTLHAPLFLLFFSMFVLSLKTQGKALEDAKFLIAYILVSSLCILSKKTGLYIVIPSLLVSLLLLRNARALLSALLPVFVCLFLVPTLVYPAIGGVAKGGTQEAMSLFLQQSVAVGVKHYDDLPADEIEAVNTIIDFDFARDNFDPKLADPAKSTFKKNSTIQDIAAYFLVWCKQGIRYPYLYLKTTLICIGTLFVPVKGLTVYQGIHLDDLYRFQEHAAQYGHVFVITLHQPSILEPIATSIKEFLDLQLAIWPISSFFFSKGLYGGWIPVFAFMIVLFNRRKYLSWLTPIVLSTLVLLLCPVDNARYVFPLLYSWPVILGVMLYASFSKTDCNNQSTVEEFTSDAGQPIAQHD